MITETYTFVTTECCVCGVPFALTEEMHNQRKRDHRHFYCPNGHRLHFPGVSAEEKVMRLQARLTAVTDRCDTLARSKAAIQGHLTRTKRRISRGVCPCCNRTFADLQRHMESKHPKYSEADDAS